MAGLAGEGEPVLVTAAGAGGAGAAGGEVAAAHESPNGDGWRPKRAHGGAELLIRSVPPPGIEPRFKV